MQRVMLEMNPESDDDVVAMTSAAVKVVGQTLNTWGVGWQLAGQLGPEGSQLWVYVPEGSAADLVAWWLAQGRDEALARVEAERS